jgi:hypothetical protein
MLWWTLVILLHYFSPTGGAAAALAATAFFLLPMLLQLFTGIVRKLPWQAMAWENSPQGDSSNSSIQQRFVSEHTAQINR